MAPEGHPLRFLPQLSLQQVTMLDQLAQALPPARAWTITGLDQSLGVPLTIRAGVARMGGRGRSSRQACEHLLIEHLGSDAKGIIDVDAPLAISLAWLALSGEHDGSLAAPRPLDRVEQGVLLYLLARALWAGLGPKVPFRVAGVAGESPAKAADTMELPLHIEAGPVSGYCWIRAPLSFVQAFATWFGPKAKAADLDRLSRFFFGLHVQCAQSTVSLAQWRGAAKGDVLLLDELWGSPTRRGWQGEVRLRLPAGKPRWLATVDAGQLTITSHFCEKEPVPMPEYEKPVATPEELLSELPLHVSIELGRVQISAQQILSLQPGQTLRFARRAGDPVDLRVGNTLVARGELVEVEGELGVCLSEVFEHDTQRLTPVS